MSIEPATEYWSDAADEYANVIQDAIAVREENRRERQLNGMPTRELIDTWQRLTRTSPSMIGIVSRQFWVDEILRLEFGA